VVDIPGGLSTTATVTVGGSVSNSLELAGDTDWFRIQLTAGQAISVFIDGLTLADPIVRIRDASGAILYQNDDWGDGLNSFVGFAATYTGIYFIDVGSAPNNQTGTYQLSVTTYTPPPLGTIDDIANPDAGILEWRLPPFRCHARRDDHRQPHRHRCLRRRRCPAGAGAVDGHHRSHVSGGVERRANRLRPGR